MPADADNDERDPAGQDPDRVQRLFARPFFLSATIGIPFCIFKILFGITALREGFAQHGWLEVAGLLVLSWAIADLFLNTGRSLLDLLNRPAPFEFCTIAQLGRLVGAPLIFLAVDTFITFAIICTMLWTGWITLLGPVEAAFWYAATTLNLISLSAVSLYNEIRRSRA